MRHTVKAVLFSALVFPGTGHFALKKYIRGAVLLVISLISIYYFFAVASDISREVYNNMQSSDMMLDKDKLTGLVTEKLSGGEHKYISYAGIALLMCWIIGIADSFRLGRLKDKNHINAVNF